MKKSLSLNNLNRLLVLVISIFALSIISLFAITYHNNIKTNKLSATTHAHHSATLKGIKWAEDDSYIIAWTGAPGGDNHATNGIEYPITNLTITNDSSKISANPVQQFDVTETTNFDDGGTLTCYVFEMEDEEQNKYYDCVIYGNVDVIYAPEYSNSLFSNLIMYESDFSTAFWCSLANITFDNNCFDTSKVTSMSQMFFADTNSLLTSLDLSYFDTSLVEDMDSMFYGCNNLTTLDLSNFNTSNVEYMCNMFNSCSSLISIDVSSFNTSNVTDMSYMFYGCQSLTGIDLSNFDTSNVESMSDLFEGDELLTEINISSFTFKQDCDTGYMFEDSTSATHIYVSYGHKVEFVELIGDNANLTASNFIEVIDNFVFDVDGSEVTLTKYVGSAKKVVVPSSFNVGGSKTVTDLDDECFKGCGKLERVEIAETVGAIGDYAFADCPRLSKIYVYANGLEIGENTFFYNTNTSQLENFSSAKIYVPEDRVSAYKIASNWSVYASIIQAIPTFPNTGVGVDVILPSAITLTLLVAIVFVAMGNRKRKIIVK